ncbi:MAG: class I SAM-dependent rRNA methyltransferase [Myxococcales bacterium]|nr:class I SAM-dependent rRNA methyltransferase [Polyangiaceae bacterium]MDW8251666.1 class I SAM-dependent rRNA methyltransferase [Myxococcales bacterium]
MGKGSTSRRPPALIVEESAARSVQRGHPWVYREAILGDLTQHPTGTTAELRRPDGTFLARALLDPRSPLAARVLTLDPRDTNEEEIVLRRLRAAISLRSQLLADQETTAYRLSNGEGDGLPGMVIDRYERWSVLRADGAAALAFAERHGPRIEKALTEVGVTSVTLRPRDGTPRAWLGEEAPASVIALEHGMKMHVDLLHGQKTGAFLDQRENRRRVRGLAKGRRTLNLFSYAGGFSVAAALGGALEVTSVDIASSGHGTAQHTFRANGLDPGAHRFVTADVFAFLNAALQRKERWDLVICDPPSFAPNERARTRAMVTYRRLHEACLAVLSPGGILCAASCSSHITPDDFLTTIPNSPGLRVAEIHGQPADHPVTPAWIEGRYLKFVVCLLTGT